MICKLHLDLIEVTQRVVQDWLLALALTLGLLGNLLLLSGLLLWVGCERHKHARLQLLSTWTLCLRSWLYWSTSEDISRTTWCTQRHLRLWLRARVRKQAIRAMD